MRIVALGDSLTVGENEFDLSDSDDYASYPRYLEILAQEHLRGRQTRTEVNVINKGMCGDLTSGMVERFSQDVVEEKAEYVIILGGTNDVGWGVDEAVIARNLTTMYDMALNKGIVPVACSLPSILGFDGLIPPRLRLNSMIRTEAGKRKIAFVDLFAATAEPRSDRLSEKYSADGLHLNAKGYRWIGQYMFDKWLRTLLDNSTK